MHSRSAAERLAEISPKYEIVQDFLPVAENIEAQLARLYWARSGTQGFAENRVPFSVTADGYLSACAAATLFTNCEENPSPGRIEVLELGAGSGLFASFFLDTFRELCEHEGREYYHRLIYHVTDGSPATLAQWAERGMFTSHREHVRTAVCEAMDGRVSPCSDHYVPVGSLRAVFANYLLDSLPAAILRKGPSAIEQLCIRAWIDSASPGLKFAGFNSVDEVRRVLQNGIDLDQDRIARLLPFLEFESSYLALSDVPHYMEVALEAAPLETGVIVNHGALRALECWSARLQPPGFILIADYGVTSTDGAGPSGLDRFGPTVAMGLNFPLIEKALSDRGWRVRTPPGDALAPIHPRLISSDPLPQTCSSFDELFAGDRYRDIDSQLENARNAVQDARLDRAALCYRMAVEARPKDWNLLAEVADFALSSLRKPEAAADLAREAVRLNPWYSAQSWAVLGDALFELGRYADAADAFRQGLRVNSFSIRANYGLALTLLELDRCPEALASIAAALAADGAGACREQLLAAQESILEAVTAGWRRENSRLSQRAAAMSGGGMSHLNNSTAT